MCVISALNCLYNYVKHAVIVSYGTLTKTVTSRNVLYGFIRDQSFQIANDLSKKLF